MKRILWVVAIILVLSGIAVFAVAQNNRNYSQEELEAIALEQVPGEVIDVDTEFELEDLAIEYNFYIRSEENIMQEITVSTKTGAITYIEGANYD